MASMLVLALILMATPSVTPRPNGPYRVVGREILDRDLRPYLIRGTMLAPLRGDEAKP